MIQPIYSPGPSRRLLATAAAVTLTVAAASPGTAGERPDPRYPVRPAAGAPARLAAGIVLVGDTVGDPGFTPDSTADSPTESSGSFDATRGDLGEDDDLSNQGAGRRRRRLPPDAPLPADVLPDPLAGTPRVAPGATGVDAERQLASMLPSRTDGPADWHAPLEPLHACGDPGPCRPACRRRRAIRPVRRHRSISSARRARPRAARSTAGPASRGRPRRRRPATCAGSTPCTTGSSTPSTAPAERPVLVACRGRGETDAAAGEARLRDRRDAVGRPPRGRARPAMSPFLNLVRPERVRCRPRGRRRRAPMCCR